MANTMTSLPPKWLTQVDEDVSLLTSNSEPPNLNKQKFTHQDLPSLLSEAANDSIESMAQLAHAITKKRFGNTMQLFAPMYVSNLCYNTCTYCDFSINNKVKRMVMTDEQIVAEAKLLASKGFKHLLLLTGEAEPSVGADYISNAISLILPHMASVGIEVQPLTSQGYQQVFESGCDSITLYQETYHEPSYKTYHLTGKKKHFYKRLEAAERAAQTGFHRMQIGALLGLYDWRFEALALARHVDYLSKKYWKTKFSISFNRIKDISSGFKPSHLVTDKDLVKLITAFRIVFPDVGISMSTREPAILRDQLIPLGITQMSAESKTSPGGYSGDNELEQFSISDERDLDTITDLLKQKGYDPVFKDWEHCMT